MLEPLLFNLFLCDLFLILNNIDFASYADDNKLYTTDESAEKIYNLGHNILRLFDVLPNFPFTTSETNRDY